MISCPEGVIAGELFTKEKRQEVYGTIAGGSGSRKPEEYQRAMIVAGTQQPCPKTKMRINLRTNTLHHLPCPNININGFDYSEDFDGVQIIQGKQIYINLKCVVGEGGSQTRSLREVYWFVEGQLNVIKTSDQTNIFFANILDGDEAHSVLTKFEYLLSLPKFTIEKNNIYVGDLKGYFDWLKAAVVDEEQ
jgi:hypothetical protein